MISCAISNRTFVGPAASVTMGSQPTSEAARQSRDMVYCQRRVVGVEGMADRRISHGSTKLPAILTLRPAWNNGRIVGQKRPLKPKHVWAIRVRLELAEMAGAQTVVLTADKKVEFWRRMHESRLFLRRAKDRMKRRALDQGQWQREADQSGG